MISFTLITLMRRGESQRQLAAPPGGQPNRFERDHSFRYLFRPDERIRRVVVRERGANAEHVLLVRGRRIDRF